MRKKIKCVLIDIYTILLLISLLFTCACQPSPKRNAVVNGGKLQQEIEGSPAPLGTYNAPASWQETLDMKDGTKIEINTAISVPKVTAYPVYNVHQVKFNEERIKSLISYFAKGKEIIKDTEPTKSEIEEELIQTEAVLEKKKTDPSSNEDSVEDIEDDINSIKARISEAPDSVATEAITDWNPDRKISGHFVDENAEEAYISVTPDEISYGKGYATTESLLLSYDKDPIGDIAISKEDAITAAQNMLHGIGIDYMTAGSLEKAERFSSVDDAVEPKGKPISKGYIIKFVRNIDGIPGITNEGVMVNDNDDFDYKAPLYPEDILIYVDEVGKPQSFLWDCPLEIKEKVSENVSLMPFDKVQQRIRDMLTFINSYDSIPMKITKVELNMAIVNVKDHPDEAMYVPAWFIYYTEIFKDVKDGNKESTQDLRLGLNAIDGGRVLERPVQRPNNETAEQTDVK